MPPTPQNWYLFRQTNIVKEVETQSVKWWGFFLLNIEMVFNVADAEKSASEEQKLYKYRPLSNFH